MKKIMIFLSLSVCLCSCSGMIAEIKEMKALQQDISTKFNFQAVGVKVVSGDHIMVTLINSRYNDSTDKAKQNVSDSIATVCSGYFKNKHITDGLVSFVSENKTGMVKNDDYHNCNIRIRQ